MKIGYYAIFNYDEKLKGNPVEYSISISFPDVPLAISCARTYNEGVFMAKEVLEFITAKLHVYELPKMSTLEDITLKTNEEAVYISYNSEDVDLSTFLEFE